MTETLSMDGFTNIVSAIGQANGKTSANGYAARVYSQHEIETAYDSSTWFGKIVDIPAEDATREWRAWKADKPQIEDLEATEKRLSLQQKVHQALVWARLYGGAVIIPDLPGNPASPVNLDAIKAGSIRFLSVLHRFDIQAEGFVRNPLSPFYGQPERYLVNTDQTPIEFHPSRVILINGRTVGSRRSGGDIWGKTIWANMSDSILASDSGAAVIAALLQEAKIDVVAVQDLMDSMSSAQYETNLLKRWQLVAVLKSVANITLIDKGDDWQQKTMNWTGLPDVIMTLLTIMAGAADIPVTRLIGTSATGLNATGAGDLINYYDSVRAKQDLSLSPMLRPLDDMIIRAALGSRPDEVWYDWKPLWVPDLKTQAETQKLRAETFQIELATGAIDEEALTKTYLNAAIESGLYPGLEGHIEDAGNDGLAFGNTPMDPSLDPPPTPVDTTVNI